MSEVPDWLEKPNWLFLILATAVITVLVRRALPALLGGARNCLRRVNHWRKLLIGTKRTRAGVISRWENAPPWVLRATVFRWFEADPQAWYAYMKQVHDSHNSKAVRESARCLLWVDKTVAALQVGDVYHPGHHALALSHYGDRIRVLKTVDGDASTDLVAHPVRVNRGWCQHGDACPSCSWTIRSSKPSPNGTDRRA